LGLGLKFRFIT